MANVVLFGLGKLAEVMHFYLTHDSPHTVVAFTANSAYVNTTQLLGLPVLPFEELERRYPPELNEMLVAVGYQRVNQLRAEKCLEAREKGYQLATYVSSKAATWPGLTTGENCVIFEQNVIQPFVEIGSDVIMWSGNHIGHHSVIE